MKIIITGATGYLGSRLTRNLLRLGHDILCLVVPNDPSTSLNDIKKNLLFLSTQDAMFDERIMEFKPNVVINTATVYARGNNTVDQVFEANLAFPFRVMNVAVKCGDVRWLNAASSLPLNLDAYALSKAQCSQWGELFSRSGNFTFVNLKLEHFYGENGADTHFLAWVVRKLKANEPIDLTKGTQLRDFVYIGDVVDCFTHMLTAPVTGYLQIHIGTGEAPSVREVVEYLKEQCHSSSELHFGAIDSRKNEPDCICDTTGMRELGMQCRVLWREGMKKLI